MKRLSELSVIIPKMDAVVNVSHGEILQEKFINLKPGKVGSTFNHYTVLFNWLTFSINNFCHLGFQQRREIQAR